MRGVMPKVGAHVVEELVKYRGAIGYALRTRTVCPTNKTVRGGDERVVERLTLEALLEKEIKLR
jgi:hypothetical protein